MIHDHRSRRQHRQVVAHLVVQLPDVGLVDVCGPSVAVDVAGVRREQLVDCRERSCDFGQIEELDLLAVDERIVVDSQLSCVKGCIISEFILSFSFRSRYTCSSILEYRFLWIRT